MICGGINIKKKGLIKETTDILLAPVVVGIVALALFFLGTLPAHLQKPAGVTDYETIEAAQSELGFKVLLPTYFPNYLAWPPARVQGQTTPVPAIELDFLSSVQQTDTLALLQIISDVEDLSMPVPWVVNVSERMPVTINSIPGQLIIGRDKNGNLLNAVQWRVSGRHFVLVTTKSVRELLLLARSIPIQLVLHQAS